MIPLTNEQKKKRHKKKRTYDALTRKSSNISTLMIKIIAKLDKNYCHYTGRYRDAVHSISNLKKSIPNKTLVVSDNGSNYDDHFIIKELAKQFEIQNLFSSNNKRNKKDQ